jgi:hypothetical protein
LGVLTGFVLNATASIATDEDDGDDDIVALIVVGAVAAHHVSARPLP